MARHKAAAIPHTLAAIRKHNLLYPPPGRAVPPPEAARTPIDATQSPTEKIPSADLDTAHPQPTGAVSPATKRCHPAPTNTVEQPPAKRRRGRPRQAVAAAADAAVAALRRNPARPCKAAPPAAVQAAAPSTAPPSAPCAAPQMPAFILQALGGGSTASNEHAPPAERRSLIVVLKVRAIVGGDQMQAAMPATTAIPVECTAPVQPPTANTATAAPKKKRGRPPKTARGEGVQATLTAATHQPDVDAAVAAPRRNPARPCKAALPAAVQTATPATAPPSAPQMDGASTASDEHAPPAERRSLIVVLKVRTIVGGVAGDISGTTATTAATTAMPVEGTATAQPPTASTATDPPKKKRGRPSKTARGEGVQATLTAGTQQPAADAGVAAPRRNPARPCKTARPAAIQSATPATAPPSAPQTVACIPQALDGAFTASDEHAPPAERRSLIVVLKVRTIVGGVAGDISGTAATTAATTAIPVEGTATAQPPTANTGTAAPKKKRGRPPKTARGEGAKATLTAGTQQPAAFPAVAPPRRNPARPCKAAGPATVLAATPATAPPSARCAAPQMPACIPQGVGDASTASNEHALPAGRRSLIVVLKVPTIVGGLAGHISGTAVTGRMQAGTAATTAIATAQPPTANTATFPPKRKRGRPRKAQPLQ
ncbi:hypothetical protein FN846DRAFT_913707 [Sphaerosporella brunnea]|uniref:Uncharacterized protein n=1 Tax=Sphaerosporella brunnea TaxID=1250544 RepID=A0A5J5EF30_9PEZI|nr:hypothetical protein FN846DRAFT_913707 [Sphaerosporella brunnea]